MNRRQLEAWALQIIDSIKDKIIAEDSLVEFKRTFPDAQKAARRIAGHANAARGDSILWLIGIDEKQGVVGINNDIDLATWWPQVESCFDGIAPYLTDLVIPSEDKKVIALLFETDRAPFVVKNPHGGQIQFEIPWRSGTLIRSAKREEIIRLIVPLERIPNLEIIHGSCSLVKGGQNSDKYSLSIQAYVTPKANKRLIVPFHKCSISLRGKSHYEWFYVENFSIRPEGHYKKEILNDAIPSPFRETRHYYQSTSLTIDATQSELIIDGAGLLYFEANVNTLQDGNPFHNLDAESSKSLEIKLSLGLSDCDQNASRLMSFKVDTDEMSPDVACAWTLDEVK